MKQMGIKEHVLEYVFRFKTAKCNEKALKKRRPHWKKAKQKNELTHFWSTFVETILCACIDCYHI